MKRTLQLFSHILLLLMSVGVASTLYAAEAESVEIEEIDFTSLDGGPFYIQEWFWVVMGVVFLLILIALLIGGKKKKPKMMLQEDKGATEIEGDTEGSSAAQED